VFGIPWWGGGGVWKREGEQPPSRVERLYGERRVLHWEIPSRWSQEGKCFSSEGGIGEWGGGIIKDTALEKRKKDSDERRDQVISREKVLRGRQAGGSINHFTKNFESRVWMCTGGEIKGMQERPTFQRGQERVGIMRRKWKLDRVLCGNKGKKINGEGVQKVKQAGGGEEVGFSKGT